MLLALASGLESGEESYGEKAEEGTTQGDPLSGPYFCVVIHKLVRKAELILRNSVGMVRYGWDDGYLLGKKKKVFQALEEISRQGQRRSGMVRLYFVKTDIFKNAFFWNFFIRNDLSRVDLIIKMVLEFLSNL